jgi:NADH:ubiquinone reductase (H+-translocating)
MTGSGTWINCSGADQHDYDQVITELPRVAGGSRDASAVRIPVEDMLAGRVRCIQTEISGFDLAGQRLRTWAEGT